MQDVLFIAILVAFFALAGVFVKACERIIGPDLEAQKSEVSDTTIARVVPERAA
jgi:hypothetical protein